MSFSVEKCAKNHILEVKNVAEEAGKNALDSLNKAYKSAVPVVNEAITGTIDYVKEVIDETKPE